MTRDVGEDRNGLGRSVLFYNAESHRPTLCCKLNECRINSIENNSGTVMKFV